MAVVKKIAAVIVMILSAVLLVAMLAGIYGSWWARGEGIQLVTDLTEVANRSLERAQELVNQADQQVQESKSRVDQLATNIEKAGATVEQTNLALVAAEAIFDKDLSPKVQQLTESAQEVRDTLAVIDRALGVAASLPFGRDSELLATAEAVMEKIKALGQTLADTRQAVKDAKSASTDKLVSVLTEPLARSSARLETLSGELGQVSQRVAERQANLLILRDRLNRTLTLAAVVLTLVFLWMALAQLGLFVHAYGVFTGRDPLARWHKRAAAEAPTASAPLATGA